MAVRLDATAVADEAVEPVEPVESADTGWSEIEGGATEPKEQEGGPGETAEMIPVQTEAAETPPTQEEVGTIEAAISAASDGDRIKIEPGTFTSAVSLDASALAKLEEEFRQRMRNAADETADATLKRMAAERAVKDAKAAEKLAAQAFEQLRLEVGREYPLIDALESQKTAEENLADTPTDGEEDTSAESTDNPPAETPTVVIDKVHWAKAPIAVLKLTKGAEKALVEKNEITTVGQLAEYMEANGTVSGLDGIPKDSTRAKKIEEKFHAFIESQK